MSLILIIVIVHRASPPSPGRLALSTLSVPVLFIVVVITSIGITAVSFKAKHLSCTGCTCGPLDYLVRAA